MASSSYVPSPVSPPVSADYIVGLLDTTLKIDVLNGRTIRASIVSPEIRTIDVVRSFFKTQRETVSFHPLAAADKPATVTIHLPREEQHRALVLVAAHGILNKEVARAALELWDIDITAVTPAAIDGLKTAISLTKKTSSSSASASAASPEDTTADTPEVTPDYVAAIVDQKLLSESAKPRAAAIVVDGNAADVVPVVAAAVAADEEEEEGVGDTETETETTGTTTGKAVKPRNKKKRPPQPRYGKLSLNLTKPQGKIGDAIKHQFGGKSNDKAPHRLRITHDDAQKWLDEILPKTRIRTGLFDVVRVPV